MDNDLQNAIQFMMNTDRFRDVCETLAFRTKTHGYRLSYEVAEGSTILWVMVNRKNSISYIEVERGCSSKLTFRNATYLGNRKGPTYTDITSFFEDIHYPTKEEIQLVCMIEPFICGCVAQVGKDLLDRFGR